MSKEPITRKLTAILYADVARYSQLTGADEIGTHKRLSAALDLISRRIADGGGRVVHYAGDAVLAEFSSVVAAVETAVAVQAAVSEVNGEIPKEKCLEFRIGVNLGEVIVDRDDIYGDGVNVAARLESLAMPGGVCVSAAVHEQVRGKLDLVFQDIGARTVKNIADPVHAYRVVLEAGAAGAQSTARLADAPSALSEKPSLAVLPFSNMSENRDFDYLADGLAEDIITTLTKVSGLFVIARNTSFVYKNQTRDVRRIAADLGVRFILDGSIRTAARRMRVSVQLIDAKDGGHVWAERYDRTLDDIFSVQDEITLHIATELQVQLTEGEQARIRYTTTSNVEAWNNWVEGLAYFRSAVRKDGVGRARRCWEKALALDPHSATLNAMLGLLHWASARDEWWDDPQKSLERSEEYVRMALAIDADDGDAHMVRALQLLSRGRHDEAVAEIRRAIDLAPGSADVAAFASFLLSFSGLPREGLAQVEKAMRLSPICPAWYLGDLGFAHRLLGDFEEAIRAFQEYGARSPGFGHIDLVIVYGDLGRADDARAEASRLLAARPEFKVSTWRRTQLYKDSNRLDADVRALLAAGLPE